MLLKILIKHQLFDDTVNIINYERSVLNQRPPYHSVTIDYYDAYLWFNRKQYANSKSKYKAVIKALENKEVKKQVPIEEVEVWKELAMAYHLLDKFMKLWEMHIETLNLITISLIIILWDA